jgi:hypothetical protein
MSVISKELSSGFSQPDRWPATPLKNFEDMTPANTQAAEREWNLHRSRDSLGKNRKEQQRREDIADEKPIGLDFDLLMEALTAQIPGLQVTAV